jgi:hypothetical protein
MRMRSTLLCLILLLTLVTNVVAGIEGAYDLNGSAATLISFTQQGGGLVTYVFALPGGTWFTGQCDPQQVDPEVPGLVSCNGDLFDQQGSNIGATYFQVLTDR